MSDRIFTRCPACKNDTLTINGGHLLCTWHECPDPTQIERGDETQEKLDSVRILFTEIRDECARLRDQRNGLLNALKEALKYGTNMPRCCQKKARMAITSASRP